MPYPDEIDVFPAKLNKRADGSAYTVQEELPITDGKYEGVLAHDNIANSTVSVYTGPNLTGDEVTSFTVSIPADTPWRRNIRIFASVETVYVTYQTPGDQVDAGDINALQETVTATQTEVDRYKVENDTAVTSLSEQMSAVESGKAEQTYVDSQLLLKSDKSSTYTKIETDQRINEIIGAAPEALDTLQEIAVALNNDPDFAATMTTQLAGKVDKISGKGLSTEDYSTSEKTKLAGIAAGANNYTHPSSHPPSIIAQDAGNRFVSDAEKSAWNAKAEADTATTEGAGLMSAADKSKLDGVAAGATNYVHPATHLPSIIAQDANSRFVSDAEKSAWNAKASTDTVTGSADGLMSAADKGKLDGVEDGANNYTHPATHPPSIIAQNASNRFVSDSEKATWNAKASTDTATGSIDGLMSAADKGKLDGVAEGAQVNAVSSVAGRTGAVSLSKGDVGLGSLENYAVATQAEAETGTSSTKYMTPLRTAQAIDSRLADVGGGDMLKSVYDTNDNGKVDQAEAADSVPWAGVTGKPSTFAPAAHEHSGADITSGTVAAARLPAASTSAAGIAQLSSATNSSSTTQAATPSAVKAAYDLASGKLSPGVTWGQLRGGA